MHVVELSFSKLSRFLTRMKDGVKVYKSMLPCYLLGKLYCWYIYINRIENVISHNIMAEEFKAIVSKVSEGLNFFDFSFFVSGFMTFVVLCYSVNVLFYRIIYFSTFVDYLVAIVLIYISGVISFVSGKFLRNKIRKRQEVDEAPTKWYHIRSFKYIYP